MKKLIVAVTLVGTMFLILTYYLRKLGQALDQMVDDETEDVLPDTEAIREVDDALAVYPDSWEIRGRRGGTVE